MSLKKRLCSKDDVKIVKEKSLVKNYAFNVIYNLLNILFPIITTSYVSRILFADGVGKVAFANNIVSYFLVN